MKLDCGLTWADEKKRLENWHEWFAWYPVQLGSHDCRWLEVVMRKGMYCEIIYAPSIWFWEYKAKETA